MYSFCELSMKWMKSYLNDRKQRVEISGKISSDQDITIGTPQGSRLSPLIFLILMADLDSWTKNSMLSNFADDTQSIIISEDRNNLLEITTRKANHVIDFLGVII